MRVMVQRGPDWPRDCRHPCTSGRNGGVRHLGRTCPWSDVRNSLAGDIAVAIVRGGWVIGVEPRLLGSISNGGSGCIDHCCRYACAGGRHRWRFLSFPQQRKMAMFQIAPAAQIIVVVWSVAAHTTKAFESDWSNVPNLPHRHRCSWIIPPPSAVKAKHPHFHSVLHALPQPNLLAFDFPIRHGFAMLQTSTTLTVANSYHCEVNCETCEFDQMQAMRCERDGEIVVNALWTCEM